MNNLFEELGEALNPNSADSLRLKDTLHAIAYAINKLESSDDQPSDCMHHVFLHGKERALKLFRLKAKVK